MVFSGDFGAVTVTFRGFRRVSGTLQGIREVFREFSVAFREISDDFQRISEALQGRLRGFWRVCGA